jgi:hypothetical protein
MATLNLTKVGGLVLIEYTGRADKLISASNPLLEISMPGDGTSSVDINLAGASYSLTAITDLKVATVAASNQADALIKLATVFPDAGSAGGSGEVGATSYATNAAAVAALGAGVLYKSTTLINGSPIILITV